jgi:hypothetical protein
LQRPRRARQPVALEEEIEGGAVEDSVLLDERERADVGGDELGHDPEDPVVGRAVDVEPQGGRQAQLLRHAGTAAQHVPIGSTEGARERAGAVVGANDGRDVPHGLAVLARQPAEVAPRERGGDQILEGGELPVEVEEGPRPATRHDANQRRRVPWRRREAVLALRHRAHPRKVGVGAVPAAGCEMMLVDQMAGAAVDRRACERAGEGPRARRGALENRISAIQLRVEIGRVGSEELREAGLEEEPLAELDGGRFLLFLGRALGRPLVLGGLGGGDADVVPAGDGHDRHRG